MPIQDHTEMDESLTNVIAKLGAKNYERAFGEAFASPEITPEKIGLALESFLLTLTSFDSKFDRAIRGEAQLTDQEKRGFELFMTEYDPRREQYGADCFHCHGGALFQSQTFANNGLDTKLTDPGRSKITGKDSDQGKFSTPSLRNIASPRRTCTMAASARWKKSSSTTAPACGAAPRSTRIWPSIPTAGCT